VGQPVKAGPFYFSWFRLGTCHSEPQRHPKCVRSKPDAAWDGGVLGFTQRQRREIL